MTPEREREIERICDEALECPPADRDRFLTDACGGDESLRVQVELLLAQEPRAASFLETPALLAAGRQIRASRDGGDAADGATTLPPGAEANTRAGASRALAQHAPLDDARFAPGEIFASRHRIVSLLGRGAMGEVYRADDLKLGQPVALKLLATASEDGGGRVQRFIAEVRHARTISHPNVCRVHDIGEADGWWYISMELVDGETLASLLRRIGRLPLEKTLDIARQLCAGLAAAHDRGVLHRDLKPSNIMIDGRGQVRILDFGLAVSRSDWTVGEIAGTPGYMAPEQLVGDRATERTDVYALGLIVYELYAGRPVFPIPSDGQHNHDRPAVPVVPGLDPAIDRLIRSCLERDPINRPASALEIASRLPGGDLLVAAMAKGLVPSPEMVAAAGSRGALRRAHAWGLLSAILIILAGIATQVHVLTVRPADVPKPPEVLAERARNILASVGAGDAAGDSEGWFAVDPDLTFIYRQSPKYLVAQNLFRVVTDADPPSDVPGMAMITLDPGGRLIRFSRTVQSDALRSVGEPEIDWSTLFGEAGLNLAEFVPEQPSRLPSVPHDRRLAWVRASTDPGTRRVTAATLAGGIVQFDATGGHDLQVDPLRGPFSAGRTPATYLAFWTVLISVLAGSLVLARYNLRLGQGDRRGAQKLAILVVALGVATAVLRAHHVPVVVDEITFLLGGTGFALAWAGLVWLMYISLEPSVRRVWPRTLISWNRLLAGRGRDPLVGRDILIGMLAGTAVVAIWTVAFSVTERSTVALSASTVLESLQSTPRFISALTFHVVETLVAVLVDVFVLLLLRVSLRRTWIAALVFLLVTSPFTLMENQTWGQALLFLVAGPLLGVVLLLRVGLLAYLAMMISYVLSRVPITLDPAAWYFGHSLVVLFLLAALAVYGFLVSLGGRPAFGTNAV